MSGYAVGIGSCCSTGKERKDVHIKVLGSGCANCRRLEATTREVVQELGLEATVEKVTDIKDILTYGVMATPALVIDEKVVLSGSVPGKAKLTEIITTHLAR